MWLVRQTMLLVVESIVPRAHVINRYFINQNVTSYESERGIYTTMTSFFTHLDIIEIKKETHS